MALAKTVLLMAVALAATAGCAAMPSNVGARARAAGKLDGRTFHVSLVSDLGGAPGAIDLVFDSGRFDVKDDADPGHAAAPYFEHAGDDGVDFRAETRSPSGIRRFRGRVAGSLIDGTLLLAPDGGRPLFYSFHGHTI
jgi:hypothetical protein